MVAFKKMWSDVSNLIDAGDIKDLDIIERFKSGFTIRDQDEIEFVTKDDFVDFWGKMLYFNEMSENQVLRQERSRAKYIYALIKMLPYVDEVSGVLRLTE